MAEISISSEAKNQRPEVSIIIVNWNTKKEILKAIKSIYNNCTLKFEIIVVDNNSKDNSDKILKKKYPKIRIIKNEKNLGYAKANNQGVRAAKSNHIIILNPDTEVQKQTLENLLRFFKHNPRLGAVVPKLLNPDGTIQYFYHRKLPNIKYQIASFIHNYTPFKSFSWARQLFLLDQKFETDTKIEQAAGVCILTNKKIISKIGGLFDENLPIFLNDIDFSARVKKYKLSIYLVAGSRIVHHRSSSTGKLDPYTLRQEVILSSLYYARKNNGYLSYLILKVLIILLLSVLIILTSIGMLKKYFMTPITNRQLSLVKQWGNLTATIVEKRNHPGLVLAS